MIVKTKYEAAAKQQKHKKLDLFDNYCRKKIRLSKRNAIDDIFFLLEYWDVTDIKIFCQSACRIPSLDYKQSNVEVQTEGQNSDIFTNFSELHQSKSSQIYSRLPYNYQKVNLSSTVIQKLNQTLKDSDLLDKKSNFTQTSPILLHEKFSQTILKKLEDQASQTVDGLQGTRMKHQETFTENGLILPADLKNREIVLGKSPVNLLPPIPKQKGQASPISSSRERIMDILNTSNLRASHLKKSLSNNSINCPAHKETSSNVCQRPKIFLHRRSKSQNTCTSNNLPLPNFHRQNSNGTRSWKVRKSKSDASRDFRCFQFSGPSTFHSFFELFGVYQPKEYQNNSTL